MYYNGLWLVSLYVTHFSDSNPCFFIMTKPTYICHNVKNEIESEECPFLSHGPMYSILTSIALT